MLTMADKGGIGGKANADICCQWGEMILAINDISDKMTKN